MQFECTAKDSAFGCSGTLGWAFGASAICTGGRAGAEEDLQSGNVPRLVAEAEDAGGQRYSQGELVIIRRSCKKFKEQLIADFGFNGACKDGRVVEWGSAVLSAGGQLQQLHGYFGGLRFTSDRKINTNGGNLFLLFFFIC